MLKRILFLLLAACCVVACNNNDLKTDEDVGQSKEITLKKGMLVFPDDETFKLVMGGKMDIPGYLNFVSQQDIFNQIMSAEETHAAKLETLDVKNTEDFESFYSDLYKEKLKSGFIKTEKLSDGAELYDLNLSQPQYAKILNEEGFYAIGNNIYQITPKAQKAWLNGNINEYQKLAELKTSDDAKEMYVSDPSKEMIQTRLASFKASNLDLTIKHPINETNFRYYVKSYDKTSLNMPPVSYKRETYFRVIAQKKSGSKWIYNTDFTHKFWYRINIEDAAGNFLKTAAINNTATGGNVYYNMYCHPDWLMIYEAAPAGQIEYTNDYVYLGAFQFMLTGVNSSTPCQMDCETYYNGVAESKEWRFGHGFDCIQSYFTE